jgi:3-isopropylmalate dehydratase small subunit
MVMTMIEKILAVHSKYNSVKPGEIIDIDIDARVARDFGGANVVRNITENNLTVDDPERTFFTFDCNPTGSDQKYAVNQHLCRLFARDNSIRIFDIDSGIGTHILIDEGIVWPGSTAVSTDSHANILGAIGAFGQGMGDMDIAASWHKGKIWFKVPNSVRINLIGELPGKISSKDIILNLLKIFGANTLLGCSAEICGKPAEHLTLDDRITISSMATEMGAITILFPPTDEILEFFKNRGRKDFVPVYADKNAFYLKSYDIDVSSFPQMVSRPGKPHDTVDIDEVRGQKIDSAFIGSCTNGRISDLEKTAMILRHRKVAPGVVLKIVPATDRIWNEALEKGLVSIFKNAGALVSNAGCAGCAAGQVGQNGPGEITISAGNRNFPGKQGKGSVYLASPEIVAASAIAGYITTPDSIPDQPAVFKPSGKSISQKKKTSVSSDNIEKSSALEGKVWVIGKDNIDTDMIFHNRYLALTQIKEMGQYTFDNLEGYENFAGKAQLGDIVVTGKNFGSGSSRQQAVDCFISLGINAIVAESFGAIYERNAINAAFPVVTCTKIADLELIDGDRIRLDLLSGKIENLRNGREVKAEPFSEVQYNIYKNGGLL